MKYLILIIAIMFITCAFSFVIGMHCNQERIESRAKNIDSQECYSDKDIEYILFGESQL